MNFPQEDKPPPQIYNPIDLQQIMQHPVLPPDQMRKVLIENDSSDESEQSRGSKIK